MLILIDQPDIGVKEPTHLIAKPGPLAPAAATVTVDTQLPHELSQRRAQDQLAALGPHRLRTKPGKQ